MNEQEPDKSDMRGNSEAKGLSSLDTQERSS